MKTNKKNHRLNLSALAVGAAAILVAFAVLLGNLVTTLVDENKPKGHYSVQFDGSNLSSGIYIYRLNYAGIMINKKMILLK